MHVVLLYFAEHTITSFDVIKSVISNVRVSSRVDSGAHVSLHPGLKLVKGCLVGPRSIFCSGVYSLNTVPREGASALKTLGEACYAFGIFAHSCSEHCSLKSCRRRSCRSIATRCPGRPKARRVRARPSLVERAKKRVIKASMASKHDALAGWRSAPGSFENGKRR
jgi:hypothetical protein